MTTIDELGRQAATVARTDAADLAAARMEPGLDRLRLDMPVLLTRRSGADPRRWVMLGAAVAVSAAAIVALAINAGEGQSHRVVPGATSTRVTTTPNFSL